MSVTIVTNTIAMPDMRQAVSEAVTAGLGSRPLDENWKVFIFEPPDRPDYIVTIEGPNNFRWKRDFFGPSEQTAEFIRSEVRRATSWPRPAPLDYDPIIERLLRRSQEGKVRWEKVESAERFVCRLEIGPGRVYTFEVARAEDTYSLQMRDESSREVFSVSAEQEIVFGPWEERMLFNRLRDLFELARRKALNVDQKLAEVASVLDAI